MTAGDELAGDELAVGDILSPVVLEVTMTTLMGIAATTWDYFPGHHDRDYARRQGQPDIYLSTMALAGFLDRVATAATGPGWFLRSRSMTMSASVFLGDTLTGTATVVEKTVGNDGPQSIRLSIIASTGRGLCVSAESVLRRPNNCSWRSS